MYNILIFFVLLIVLTNWIFSKQLTIEKHNFLEMKSSENESYKHTNNSKNNYVMYLKKIPMNVSTPLKELNTTLKNTSNNYKNSNQMITISKNNKAKIVQKSNRPYLTNKIYRLFIG
jgi:glucosamine 6-phosphate synthetase-like amidotransferase/phosphosugar isomerase protein